jgi:hypothetical protein
MASSSEMLGHELYCTNVSHIQQDKNNMNAERSVAVLNWVAKIWSIASIGLLCFFLFGEGLPPLSAQAMMFPFGVMLGLILAWWFERIGGLLTVMCMLLFYMIEYLGHGRFPKGYFFIIISAPSVIFLCCGFLKAKQLNGTIAKPKTATE